MTARKPSERWKLEEHHHWWLDAGFVAAAVAVCHNLVEWEVYGHNDALCGDAETLEAAQLAAEDALLEIAREIREAVGRD